MLFIGVDPGLLGAFAFFDEEDPIDCLFEDMPYLARKRGKKERKQVIESMILDTLQVPLDAGLKPWECYGIVEDVWGFKPEDHGDGSSARSVSAEFNFGMGYGAIKTAFLAKQIPHEFVAPGTWQKGVRAGGGKSMNIIRCQQLIPKANLIKPGCRKPSDGRADAALMAYWGYLNVIRRKPE